MNIDFTDKELQVIQLMVPELTPEQTCNKVLRDWFNANLPRMQQALQPSDQVLDTIIAAATTTPIETTPATL